MASYNTVITNEGAALLASVIANQGTLTFSEMRFSTTDYDGVEATLTVGTFAGVFITAAASASVVDSTTIKVDAQFDNSGIVGDHPLYSIGIVGTDGNTTALIAVCTTTNPDIIRAALTGVSTYAFNVNLTVSSTSNITVTGTTAAVLYDTDIVDHLNSTDATKPLSANMGHVLGEEVNAIVNVYGAKNKLPNLMKKPYTDYGGTFTPNSDGSVVVSGTVATQDIYCPLMGDVNTRWIPTRGDYIATGGNVTALLVLHAYSGNLYVKTLAISPTTESFTIDYSDYDNIRPFIVVLNGTDLTTPVTVYPMARDARIVDPTYEPYAETNQQLTVNKANRNELQHENLLHNAYFMGGGSQQGGHQFPINNEGLTSYPVGSAWGIDGWDIEETNNASMNILSDGIVIIHPNVAGTYTIHQYIDNYEQYIGKTITVTFLGTLLEGTSCNIVAWYHPLSTDYRGDYLNTSFSDGLKSLTFTVPNDATGLAITISASGANQPYKLKLQAAKLELGSMQTLAHKELLLR